LQESLDLYREERHAYLIHALGALGHVERETGDYVQATNLYRESIRLRREIGDVLLIACSLEDFAGLAWRQGRAERAVRLLGAAEVLGASLGRALPIGMAAEYERTVATTRTALGAEAFAAAWAEGSAMTCEQAVTFALAEGSSEPIAASAEE
jgi:non-specific serine/threonine protein kinase